MRTKPYIDSHESNIEDFHQDILFIEADKWWMEEQEYMEYMMELMESRKTEVATEDIEHEVVSTELNNNLPF